MLHDELRAAREQAGLSQAQLGQLAGIPRNQIVRAEKGENITIDTLRKIAACLPVTELTLLDRVKLSTDILPVHDKIYIGSLETLLATLVAMAKALRHAESTFEALQDTHRHATAEEGAQHAAEPDPSFLFQSIARNIANVHDRLQRIA